MRAPAVHGLSEQLTAAINTWKVSATIAYQPLSPAVMEKQRTTASQPRKLTDFFPRYMSGENQDGAGSSHTDCHSTAAAAVEHRQSAPEGTQTDHEEEEDISDPHSPLKEHNKRPATSPLNSPLSRPQVSKKLNLAPSHTAPPPSAWDNPLEQIPTSDKPASASELKNMLQSLYVGIQSNIERALKSTQDRITQVEERTEAVETKVGELVKAHNNMVDNSHENMTEMQKLKDKIADLEDRSRRNNVKIRGIPESVSPPELINYLQTLFKKILPSVTKHDLLIDRAHRLIKPHFLPAATPRDVIARIHFFHVKDMLMAAARKLKELPEPFSSFAIYADISQATANRRREFRQVTETLRAQQIKYTWGHPTKLIVHYKEKVTPIMTPNDGIKYLTQWGIPIAPPPQNKAPASGRHSAGPWDKTTTR